MLTLRNLRKSFASPGSAGTHLVVDVPAFSMQAGEQIALRGESGSGKTTLLNLIAGILRPDSGDVELAGENLATLPESQRDRIRGRHVGYIFQTFNLLQGYTALENIELAMRFGAGVNKSHARALLQRMGLAERMHYRPAQLSVGQQQRVAVARALANRPSLVLADEPTGNLDSVRAKEALELIRQACRESAAALLLVSHDREILAQFETVRDLKEINKARV